MAKGCRPVFCASDHYCPLLASSSSARVTAGDHEQAHRGLLDSMGDPADHTPHLVLPRHSLELYGYGSYDGQMRRAISDCFSRPGPRVIDDDMVYVISNDVRLSPDEWWPPVPLTSNMIQALMAVCRSDGLRASSNHCINEVYLSSHSRDLQMDMALAQLPVSEAWNEAQDLICMSGE
ncbi:hypothetical protein ACOMHN_054373 [Nucella lapillus]